MVHSGRPALHRPSITRPRDGPMRSVSRFRRVVMTAPAPCATSLRPSVTLNVCQPIGYPTNCKLVLAAPAMNPSGPSRRLAPSWRSSAFGGYCVLFALRATNSRSRVITVSAARWRRGAPLECRSAGASEPVAFTRGPAKVIAARGDDEPVPRRGGDLGLRHRTAPEQIRFRSRD
jgi:hypothetical protein